MVIILSFHHSLSSENNVSFQIGRPGSNRLISIREVVMVVLLQVTLLLNHISFLMVLGVRYVSSLSYFPLSINIIMKMVINDLIKLPGISTTTILNASVGDANSVVVYDALRIITKLSYGISSTVMLSPSLLLSHYLVLSHSLPFALYYTISE